MSEMLSSFCLRRVTLEGGDEPRRAFCGVLRIVVAGYLVEAKAVEFEARNPIRAYVGDELLGAGVVVVDRQHAIVAGGHELPGEGRVGGRLPQPVIGKAVRPRALIDVLEHDVEQHVDLAPVAFGDQRSEPGEPIQRLAGIVHVGRLDREAIGGVVSPAEAHIVGPRDPGHELDGVDVERLHQVELVGDRVDRRARAAIFLGEVVDHQLVDDQIAGGQARRYRLRLGRQSANDKCRAVQRIAAVLGAGVADHAHRRSLKRTTY